MQTKTVEFEGFKADFVVSPNVCEFHKLPRLAHPIDVGAEMCEICDLLAIRTIVAKKGEAVKAALKEKADVQPEHPIVEPPSVAPFHTPLDDESGSTRRRR